MIKVYARLTLGIWLSCTSAWAVHPEANADSIKYRLDPMVVTASKIAGSQSELPASISVIAEHQLRESTSRSLFEVVKDYVPGVYLTERSVMGYGFANGAAGGISIRGVGGAPVTGVLVLRDGRPDIMGLMGHPLPDAYSTEGVERIEVIRGPASFLYGTNAMGGVINIVSKTMHEPGFRTTITGGMGSFDSRTMTLNHGGNIRHLDYYVTAGTRRTAGHRDFSSYDGDHYTAHTGVQLAEQTKLEFNANLANVTLFDPGPSVTPAADHWYDLRRSGADLSLNHMSGLGDSYLKLHGNFGKHKIYDGFRSTDRTVGVMLYHNAKPWTGNTLTAGLDWKRYGGDADNMLQNIDYGRHFVIEYAPYLHTQQLLLHRLLISGGVRLEHHQLYGYEVLPKAGAVLQLGAQTSVRLSAAKGFRSPSIRELYLFPAPTLDLKPEEMWNYEVGLSRQIARQARVEAALFRAEGSNLIRLAGRWPQFKLVNSGQFVHTGYELSFNWIPSEKWEVGTSWSKMDLDDQTMYAPGKKLSAFARYQLRTLDFSAHIMYVEDLYGADAHLLPMAGYTDFSAALRWQALRTIALQASVKNVLDHTYETLYGYPMPGRQLYLELSYTF